MISIQSAFAATLLLSTLPNHALSQTGIDGSGIIGYENSIFGQCFFNEEGPINCKIKNEYAYTYPQYPSIGVQRRVHIHSTIRWSDGPVTSLKYGPGGLWTDLLGGKWTQSGHGYSKAGLEMIYTNPENKNTIKTYARY